MLGKLARWMRFLGLDVAYVKDLGDDGILAAARAERRFLLTRDVELAERAKRDPGSLLITTTDPDEQLRHVLDALGLKPDRSEFLTRCSACNALLQPRSVDDVRERVPDSVAATRDEFWACPACARVYWPGTHASRISEALDSLSE